MSALSRSLVFVFLFLAIAAHAQRRPIPVLPRGVEEISICDDRLRAADWSTRSRPAAASVTTGEPLTGGNPAEHRTITIHPSPAGGTTVTTHLLTGDSLDFASDGSLVDLFATLDVRRLAGAAAVEVAIAVEQNGAIYFGPRQAVTSPNWQNRKFTLTAKDLVSLDGKNPQTGCGSSRMRLGFATFAGPSSGKATGIAIDNWCVRAHTRCCRASRAQCCDEVAPLDSTGRPIPPSDAMPNEEPEIGYVNEVVGSVKDLYPNLDTSIDTFYPKLECHRPIGDAVLPDSVKVDQHKLLANLGVEGDPVQIGSSLEAFESTFAEHVVDTEDIPFPFMGAIAGPYAPQPPYTSPRPVAFSGGGFDIVFVQGLEIEHLTRRIENRNDQATALWQPDVGFATDASAANPSFYDNGYLKTTANALWKPHVQRYLVGKGYFNRYLVVAYNSNDRLAMSALAVLRQVSDAMKFGKGVVNPVDGTKTAGFGARGLVVISYSTGALVVDVAMTAAKKYPNLGVAYVPDHTKAVIAAHGAYSGSRYASAVLADLGPPTCNVARLALQALGANVQLPACPWPFSDLKTTVLADLVPTVAQRKWGSFVRDMPVRTLTVAGEHPSSAGSLKHLLQQGFDDGVTTVNSQIANPNAVKNWPSGFVAPTRPSLFDIGIFGPSGTQPGWGLLQFGSTALANPHRAAGFFIDQAIDHLPTGPIAKKAASGPIPWISATGLLQSVESLYGTTDLATSATTGVVDGHSDLQRSQNHFSFLFSSSDHSRGVNGASDYVPTLQERNWEETSAITDPAVFALYTMPAGGSNVPLLRVDNLPGVVEIERGLRVRFRRLRRFRPEWGPWRWIWRRYYFVLAGSEQKMEFDYVYESVLK